MTTLEDRLAALITQLGADFKTFAQKLSSVVKTTTYTAAAGELVNANATTASFTVTLPSAPAAGSMVIVKKTDSSTNSVTVTSSALIDGAGSKVIYSQYGWLTLIYTGSTWNIISSSGAGDVAPVFRAAKLTYVNNANTVNALLPTGTVAGDLLVMFVVQGYGPTTPSGATVDATAFGGIYHKVATATDITNGYITVNFAGVYYGEVGIVAITGANATSPIRTVGTADVMTKTSTVITMQNAKPGDLVLYFTSSRNDVTSGMTYLGAAPGVLAASRIADADYSAYMYYGTQGSEPSLIIWNTSWSARQNNVDQFDAIAVVRA